ncbi:MAG: zinc-binding dehydrogenase [Actinomycetota bacterium]
MTVGTSHRVVVTGHGGPDVLRWTSTERPTAGDGEVVVEVHAAGVSAFDLIYRRWSRLPGRPAEPFPLGEDVVGEVVEVGGGVSGVEVGELVAAATLSIGVGGGYAEHVRLRATEVVPVPPGVDPAAAVCVVINHLTAHHHLHVLGRARSGERLLVHGAAGGVGSATVQLAELAGLDVIGTASGDRVEAVRSLGAMPIDRRTEDVVRRVRELTGDGVDLVIDPVGGAAQLWRSYRCLNRRGRLVWLGSAAVGEQGLRAAPLSMAMLAALRLVPDRRRIPWCPTTDTHAERRPGWYRRTLRELLDLVATGRLEPVIAARLPLADASRAHELLESGGHFGKFVLVTDAYRPPRAAATATGGTTT